MQRLKLFGVLMVCVVACYVAAPTVFDTDNKWFVSSKVNMGLDLQGGSFILMGVDFDTYVREYLDGACDEVGRLLGEQKISYRNLMKVDNVVNFDLANDDYAKAKDALKSMGSIFNVSNNNSRFVLSFKKSSLGKMRKDVLAESIANLHRRIDSIGVKEIKLQAYGNDKIMIQIPGDQDPESIKRMVSKTAKMTFHLAEIPHSITEQLPAGFTRMYNKSRRLFFVKSRVELGGNYLSRASVVFNKRNEPAVTFAFNGAGTKKFAELTRNNIGKPLAIVIDDVVVTAPFIREAIPGGSGEISGSFTFDEAGELAVMLRAGALPAPLKVVEEKHIGPTLGSDSIRAGKNSLLLSVVLVACVMVMFYGSYGACASLTVCMNLIFIVAVLSLVHATLTLPGIAGMVLIVGMSVDANILIFERIRDEKAKAEAGASDLAVMERGFKNAAMTIFDSNITTMIAGCILFMAGSGPIQGFAVTLILGIITSMFSAITLTRYCMICFCNIKHN